MGLMKDQEFDRVAELGRENQRAVTLLASHCGHASLEIPGGTSTFGAMVGLPIGMARVRCPHASTPGAMSMHGMDLAVAFYEDNCGGCAHRRPNGVLPTIATEVEERRQRGAAANEEAVRATAAALDQWERRREARRAAVSIEGYP